MPVAVPADLPDAIFEQGPQRPPFGTMRPDSEWKLRDPLQMREYRASASPYDCAPAGPSRPGPLGTPVANPAPPRPPFGDKNIVIIAEYLRSLLGQRAEQADPKVDADGLRWSEQAWGAGKQGNWVDCGWGATATAKSTPSIQSGDAFGGSKLSVGEQAWRPPFRMQDVTR